MLLSRQLAPTVYRPTGGCNQCCSEAEGAPRCVQRRVLHVAQRGTRYGAGSSCCLACAKCKRSTMGRPDRRADLIGRRGVRHRDERRSPPPTRPRPLIDDNRPITRRRRSPYPGPPPRVAARHQPTHPLKSGLPLLRMPSHTCTYVAIAGGPDDTVMTRPRRCGHTRDRTWSCQPPYSRTGRGWRQPPRVT